MSVLFCETNCELWYTRADELGIKVIKMPYSIEGKEYYYDLGRETDFKEFYSKVRAGAVPITSALNPQNYYEIFRPVLESGEDIFYITFSRQMSQTLAYMDQAIQQLKEEFPERKITNYDTKSISIGAGFSVYHAAQMWKNGASDEELLAWLEEFCPRVSLYFMVDNLEHLKRGGRISSVAANVGKFLNLKPIITVKDGALTTFAKVSGRRAAIKTMVKTMVKNKVDTSYPICVLDADEQEFGDSLEELIKETFGKVEIWRQPIGPVVGTHCGPGTLGICFLMSKE